MKKSHILLIDDNDIDNYINNHIIKDNDITEKISIKRSAIDALDYLEAIKDDSDAFPDLIFLDVSMPKMDGFGFLEEFVKFPQAAEKKCSVIMLTSSNNPEDRAKAMNYHVVVDYFIKPLQDEMLKGFKE
jgi:CheY-like chemotaxis protein